MSNIGKVNLDLQEQANELGFETVQEAIDNGYTALYIKPDVVKLVRKEEYELHRAHAAWLIEKETVINELTMLAQHMDNAAHKDVLARTIEFIKKGEV